METMVAIQLPKKTADFVDDCYTVDGHPFNTWGA